MFTEEETAKKPFMMYLTSLGWEYISPEKIDSRRETWKEPFILPIFKKKLLELNPSMGEEEADVVIQRIRNIRANIEGNREFLRYLRGQKTFYSKSEKRELNLRLIDFENPENNVFHYTQEFWMEDIKKDRADIVLFINGIPLFIVETKAPWLFNIVDGEVKDWRSHAVEQISRYHEEVPNFMKYFQMYMASNGLNLIYSATWNFNERNVYRWKTEEGKDYGLQDLIFSMLKKKRALRFIEDYIVFFEQDEELSKFVLLPHQVRAVERIVNRAITRDARTGLIWHTQGSGKTLTMMVAASKIRRIPELENPTIIMVVDRIELQKQLVRNLTKFGLDSIVAESKVHLRELLKSDYRGIIVTLIHKFQGMPSNINTRRNIFVFIDEAHRSQEGDLGIQMRSALPNAFYFGFTGTPIDKGKIGKGTFNLFAFEDMKKYHRPYLDKYSIKESIEDGTTVPLYYTLAPQEYRLDRKTILEEFFRLYEEKGIASIEELNKLLDKVSKIKEVLKAKKRIKKVAKHISEHYKKFVEPSGFKAMVVAVDREACALYMEAFKELYEENPHSAIPPEEIAVVYTPMHNDKGILKKYHLKEDQEDEIRRNFKKRERPPKILIVTEKLLTGYDAPILQTMYLDKPMKDHTLLQAIARVNRPYSDGELHKTAGLIVDYIGIFEDLQRALAFDSKSIEGAVFDLEVLRKRFAELMGRAEEYLRLLRDNSLSWDKKLEKLVKVFSDRKKRDDFIQLFKNIQDIYEILSPDPFLRDYLEDYKLLLKLHRFIKAQFYPTDFERRELLKKTKELIRNSVDIETIVDGLPVYKIDEHIADTIKNERIDDIVKVYNLRRSLMRYIKEHQHEVPYLEFLIEKIESIIKRLEERQISAKEALEKVIGLSESAVESVRSYKESKLDPATFSVHWLLKSYGIEDVTVSEEITKILLSNEGWTYNQNLQQGLLRKIYRILKENGVKQVRERVKIGKDLLELGRRLINDTRGSP
ncbi:Type I restriction enzyme R Protein [Thermococcus nautili]|uniref:type I restriction endonuclease subunit R n=1 Tax=Thermococcus nautili TaxID=195522 RepID=UPI002553C868|nr:type I restriction endonuclease subunit R [Thermococcus nautili]CAI1492367.1 Type I restriction enzyme R Protein [Thermococcus nautili]